MPRNEIAAGRQAQNADEKLYPKKSESRSFQAKPLTKMEAGARLGVSPGKLRVSEVE